VLRPACGAGQGGAATHSSSPDVEERGQRGTGRKTHEVCGLQRDGLSLRNNSKQFTECAYSRIRRVCKRLLEEVTGRRRRGDNGGGGGGMSEGPNVLQRRRRWIYCVL
jgi:hypothetical protein